MVHGISKIVNLFNKINTTTKVETSSVKFGGFGYGFPTTNKVGLECERVSIDNDPSMKFLCFKYEGVSAIDAIKEIKSGNIKPLEIADKDKIPDGCDQQKREFSEV